jgi:transcriptional regulator with XRE-family HTH domain
VEPAIMSALDDATIPAPFAPSVLAEDPDGATHLDHARRIGARLRRIRHQQQLSLADVQARSGGVWKAVVVGAYERGDRAVTLARLASLADFYGVPVADLLPEIPGHDDDATSRPPRVTIDLTRLDARAPELAPVARFVSLVRRRRGDHNGRMMTLRGGDLETVAMAMGLTTEEVATTLAGAGALLQLDLTGEPTLAMVTDVAGIGGMSRHPRTASRHASRSRNPAAR